MTQPAARYCLVTAFLLFCCAISSAATFNYTITCNSPTVGPISVDSFTGPFTDSGSVTLTPNVTATGLALLNDAWNTVTVNNTVTSGTFTGTLSCAITLGGVTVNYSRPLSLAVTPAGGGGCATASFAGGCLTIGAVSVTVNLGAQGTVVITAPATVNIGYQANLVVGGGIVAGASATDTALLTPAPPGTPLPTSFVLLLTGLLGAGLYRLRRKPILRRSF
jgi:hypothetical protein